MAMSKDLRERIYAAVQEGKLRHVEIFRQFKISRSGFNFFLQHEVEDIQKAIERTGATFKYLPPYSPVRKCGQKLKRYCGK